MLTLAKILATCTTFVNYLAIVTSMKYAGPPWKMHTAS